MDGLRIAAARPPTPIVGQAAGRRGAPDEGSRPSAVYLVDAGLEAKKAAEKKRPEQEAHEALDHDSRERVERAIRWRVTRAFRNPEERHEREKVSLEERKRITRDELERAMESKLG